MISNKVLLEDCGGERHYNHSLLRYGQSNAKSPSPISWPAFFFFLLLYIVPHGLTTLSESLKLVWIFWSQYHSASKYCHIEKELWVVMYTKFNTRCVPLDLLTNAIRIWAWQLAVRLSYKNLRSNFALTLVSKSVLIII